MKLEGQGVLLRIFIGESDRWQGKPLYQVLVRRAREQGLAGATVLRGMEGFGANSRVHSANILRLSQDLPLVVEIVDEEENVRAFLPQLDGLVEEGLITLERVEVILYRRGDDPPSRQEPLERTSRR
jgi:PII-like signaling protein